MSRTTSSLASPGPFPLLAQEMLYVGVDIGKRAHVAGFLSVTLLSRHQRFEHCPALSFDNSREGFRSVLDSIQTFVPLTQAQVLLARHRALASGFDAVSQRSLLSQCTSSMFRSGAKDSSNQINVMRLVWLTCSTINWRRASRWTILSRLFVGLLLPLRRQHNYVEWCSITPNWWSRAPNARTS